MPEPVKYRWFHKLGAVAASIFCFELGVFLLIYPWVKEWDLTGGLIPVGLRGVWLSSWFRGAVSGLGILNIGISFQEVFRLRRFSA